MDQKVDAKSCFGFCDEPNAQTIWTSCCGFPMLHQKRPAVYLLNRRVLAKYFSFQSFKMRAYVVFQYSICV